MRSFACPSEGVLDLHSFEKIRCCLPRWLACAGVACAAMDAFVVFLSAAYLNYRAVSNIAGVHAAGQDVIVLRALHDACTALTRDAVTDALDAQPQQDQLQQPHESVLQIHLTLMCVLFAVESPERRVELPRSLLNALAASCRAAHRWWSDAACERPDDTLLAAVSFPAENALLRAVSSVFSMLDADCFDQFLHCADATDLYRSIFSLLDSAAISETMRRRAWLVLDSVSLHQRAHFDPSSCISSGSPSQLLYALQVCENPNPGALASCYYS